VTSGRLPGAPDRRDRIVAHVDLDCFYAACERLREPALRGEPVVVGMGYEPGSDAGAVATASYEARAHGVESAQAITEALELLPRVADDPNGPAAHYRPVDMEYYESVAAEVKAVLHDAAKTVREVSVDEAYLDVTDRTDWSVAEGFGRYLRDRVEREVGLTASVGLAPTMSAAKVASDHDKPDGLVVVEPGEVREFLADLPVEAVHGVGPVRASELAQMGVETAGDLAVADPSALSSAFGERGPELRRRARGEDDREVTPRGRPKSLSRESALPDPEPGAAAVDRVRGLATAVAGRADREGAAYRTVGVKAVEPPFEVNTRERSLPGPVADADLVESVATDLFAEFHDRRVRKVGVRLSNLAFPDGEQSALGEWTGAEPGDGDGETDRTPGFAPDGRQTKLSEY
jgi:DNA polymerase IV (DinB-like DNA polymerase)